MHSVFSPFSFEIILIQFYGSRKNNFKIWHLSAGDDWRQIQLNGLLLLSVRECRYFWGKQAQNFVGLFMSQWNMPLYLEQYCQSVSLVIYIKICMQIW